MQPDSRPAVNATGKRIFALAALPQPRVVAAAGVAQPPTVPRLAIAVGWCAAAVAASVASADIPAGVVLLISVAATELLVAEDLIGAAGLSGLFAPLAALVLGCPAGMVVALGSIALGDGLLRHTAGGLLIWRAALLTMMLSAGAWVAGVPHAGALPAVAGQSVGGAWCAIYMGFAIIKARRGAALAGVAQGEACSS